MGIQCRRRQKLKRKSAYHKRRKARLKEVIAATRGKKK